jgi:hypothetical protein
VAGVLSLLKHELDTMIPDFLKDIDLGEWTKISELNKIFLIDGILPSSFVCRCERNNSPLREQIIGGKKHYKILDFIARAIADCVKITAPQKKELTLSIDELKKERDFLLQQVSSIKHELALSEASKRLTSKTLVSESDIVQSCNPLPMVTGIYFLVDKANVVYVGQSVNIFSRVSQHYSDKKQFTSFAYIVCDRAILDKMESLYIHYLKPKLNGRLNNDIVCAPLSLDDLLSGV